MVIAHVIGKSQNLETKIDKPELNFEWELFFKKHLKLVFFFLENT